VSKFDEEDLTGEEGKLRTLLQETNKRGREGHVWDGSESLRGGGFSKQEVRRKTSSTGKEGQKKGI